MSQPRKILILDGIGGVPLGREVCETFAALGIDTTHVDCLRQQRRPFYAAHSAYAKLRNRGDDRDAFYFLPKLVGDDLRQLIAREQPSHILVVGFIYKFYDPKLLRRLADEAGAGLFLYDTDTCNLYARRREFIFFVESELPAYDRILSCSAVTTRFFRDTRGLDAVFVPFGAKPIDVAPGKQPIDVLFVGSGDLRRIFLLEGIRDRVTIRGNRWQRNFPLISAPLRARIDDRPVWGEELHRLLGQSKIVLNITRTDFFGAETGINLRIFEALAAGCFLLTDHCDELAGLFRIGEEIETYRSSGELAEKVSHYLAHDDQRRAIAQAGYATFLREHTWQARIERQMLPLLARR
ncbi:MAG: glycosyltransferase [Rhodocyclales bacterium]|nr:glycosyltransferase [Rhodocyclales bacterium]